ncbi:MAG: hypothetical protein OXF55_00830 [Caldilineaceae bacterium]|nr:hypothetical protein [Caldilineaceae bacterium]MDE0429897.1 hypothetical protein [Caldilineaceae bacterium]
MCVQVGVSAHDDEISPDPPFELQIVADDQEVTLDSFVMSDFYVSPQ